MRRKLDSISPGKITWKKLKKDVWAMGGMIFIGICILISIFGYTITPDPTENADQQCVEIALAKPFSRIQFLQQEKNNRIETNFFKKLVKGSPTNYNYIPIKSILSNDDRLVVEQYINYRKEIVDIASYDVVKEKISSKPITKTFIFGTDRFGRDVMSRLMIGTRITMMVGFIAVIISVFIGILLGALAGYFRGWIDSLISWLMNIIWSIPTLLFVLTITISLGKGLLPVFVAVGLTMWVDVARIVRGEIFSIREKEFVVAGKALGFRSARIIFFHILPNVMASVLVIASSNFASAILIESGLSFLGLGAQPPTPTWGNMIETHRNFIITEHAHLALIPGFAIMFLVLAFTMVSNGLKNAMERK
jgi:ABC-type dipeptide/oligopeptide/nickel transport system permease subunit